MCRVLAFVPDCAIGLSGVYKLCRKQAPGAHGTTFVIHLFIDDREFVAFAQVAMEIDIPSEYFRQLYRDPIRYPGDIRSRKQRTAYRACLENGLWLECKLQFHCLEFFAIPHY